MMLEWREKRAGVEGASSQIGRKNYTAGFEDGEWGYE